MPPRKYKTFSKAFKQKAMRLLEPSGRPVADVARELGIHQNQLYKRQAQIRAEGEEAFPGRARQVGKKRRCADHESGGEYRFLRGR